MKETLRMAYIMEMVNMKLLTKDYIKDNSKMDYTTEKEFSDGKKTITMKENIRAVLGMGLASSQKENNNTKDFGLTANPKTIPSL